MNKAGGNRKWGARRGHWGLGARQGRAEAEEGQGRAGQGRMMQGRMMQGRGMGNLEGAEHGEEGLGNDGAEEQVAEGGHCQPTGARLQRLDL